MVAPAGLTGNGDAPKPQDRKSLKKGGLGHEGPRVEPGQKGEKVK